MSKVLPKILSYQTKGFTMKVTLHAAERFLQRVMHKVEFSFQDILNTKQFLETAMENVVVTSYRRNVVIPGFERYLGIYQENALITILPKDKKYMARNKKTKYKHHSYDYDAA